VGEQEGLSFLVMEYLEGESLADRLSRGPLPLDEALRYARQIAEALEEAHQHGIVHRDLKPGNVMLTKKGAKLLDFGISKLRPAAVSEDASTASALTGEGLIVGTPQYMAPEQLEGRPVDARTDIFAFGVVLYEMVTGRKAFEGTSRASLIAAILERDPPPVSPPSLDALVKRCLAKRPADRWPSMGDLVGRLDGIGTKARRQRLWVAAAALGAIIAALTAVLSLRGRKAPALTERDAILLGDVVNTTGESVFDDTLKQALAIQLEQSPYLRIVPDDQVRETLRFMGRSSEEKIVGDVAREICQRRGIKALLAGFIRTVGTRYVADLTASDCRTGEALAREQVQAAGREEVLPGIGAAATALRRKLGESLPSIQRHEAPIEQVTTSSLEAWKAFTLADQQRRKGGDSAAIPFYRRAIELDPQFALAYARMALMYRNLGATSLAAEAARKAFDLRDRVSERERLYIEVRYYFDVTGELGKVLEANKLLAEAYPRDSSAANNVSVNYGQVGQHEEALKASLEAVRRDPDSPVAAMSVGRNYMRLNRFAEARRQLETPPALHHRLARRFLYQAAFVRGDRPAMGQHRAAARGTPDEFDIAAAEARATASEGKWRAAQRLYEQSVELALRRNVEPAAAIAAEHSLFAAFFGDDKAAITLARKAAAMSPNPHAIWMAAVALAASGATVEAQKLIEAVARDHPLHTLVQSVGLASARAAVELRQGHAEAAVARLAPASPYELGDPPWSGPACLPIYLRGLAFLAGVRATEAAGEFQKIIDHRGLNPVSPIWPLAHLGLARAYAAAGDAARAREIYETLLAMWKDADPGVPLIRRARLEYGFSKPVAERR
jgi:tetratricopeptide (TPR) repeat protein